jgi:hypothetical protein
MSIKTKRILARCEPGPSRPELVYAEPGATALLAHASALMPDIMHSAQVWVPNPFESHGQAIRVMMYHQATRNDCPENEFGTRLLRDLTTERIKGRSRTTAYGDIWLDFGLQDIAVFENITTRVKFNDPGEFNTFRSNADTWFPGCKVEFHLSWKGSIDLHVFSPRSVPDQNLFHAKMHWG